MLDREAIADVKTLHSVEFAYFAQRNLRCVLKCSWLSPKLSGKKVTGSHNPPRNKWIPEKGNSGGKRACWHRKISYIATLAGFGRMRLLVRSEDTTWRK